MGMAPAIATPQCRCGCSIRPRQSNRTPLSSSAVTLRMSLSCNLTEVPPARQAVRSFLAAQGLRERELGACELALVEACNNAIQYVSQAGRHQPIAVRVR